MPRIVHLFYSSIFLLCFSLQAKEVKRSVLALWDSSEFSGKDYTFTPLHQELELVLNHYGLNVDYIDIANNVEKALAQVRIEKYTGVVSWFLDESIRDGSAYIRFLNRVLDKKLKLVILGQWGFLEDEKIDRRELNRFYDKLGIEDGEFYTTNPLVLSPQFLVEKSDLEFERKLANELFKVRQFISVSKKNKVWLRVNIQGKARGADTVIQGPWGMYIQRGFEHFQHPTNFRNQWRVNPFKVVREVFYREAYPIPDTTTLCGRRMLFVHIDGDGFINVSNIDRKSLSAEIVYKEVIRKYKLPTTSSVIVAEIDPAILGSEDALKAAKKIFSLSYVEPASHTFSHPLSWSMLPTREERMTYLDDKLVDQHRGPIIAYKIKNYSLSYKKEVKDSLDYIDKKLLDDGEKTKMMLWSGNCRPPITAFKFLEGGILNMNGGDSRFDKIYNSYSNLSSLYRQVGQYTQVYTASSNENLYTNLWTGPYSGFRDLIMTLKNTGTPIRIKPLNIYYHFYSGEHKSSLKALKEVYDYALKESVNPVFASRYIKTVLDFRKIKIDKLGEGLFEIKHAPNLKTLRFEGVDLFPDLERSKNIIGFKREGEILYIHLGGKESSRLVLTKTPPKRPYISTCNADIVSFSKSKTGLQISGRSSYPFSIEFFDGSKFKTLNTKKVGRFELEVK
jgi:hypothetical protein